MKNRVLLEVFGRSKVAYEGLNPQSRSNSTKNGRARKIPSGESAFPPLLTNLSISHSFLGFGLGEEDSCSPGSKRKRLDGGIRRRVEERNSLRNPSCVYVFTEAAEILRSNK